MDSKFKRWAARGLILVIGLLAVVLVVGQIVAMVLFPVYYS